jgi:sporulation protein YlmC with PRC-barrel domain
MIHWKEFQAKPVLVEERDNKPIGQLSACFINPETGKVIAYLAGFVRVLSPVDILKVTKEAIHVRSLDVFVIPNELVRLQNFGLRHCLINKKRVKSKKGKSYGRVRDFDINSLSGRITKIHVSKKFLTLEWAKRSLSWRDIHEIKERAVIMKHEPEVPEKIRFKKTAPSAS